MQRRKTPILRHGDPKTQVYDRIAEKALSDTKILPLILDILTAVPQIHPGKLICEIDF
jgi:hypothetical protein